MTPKLNASIIEAQTGFRSVNGAVFLGPLSLSPTACQGLLDIFYSEAGVAAMAGNLRTYRSARELHFALHDAIVAASQDSPDRWKAALGFLPSTDIGSAA